MGRGVPETKALRTHITIDHKVSRGHVLVGGMEKMNTVRRFNVSSGPSEVVSNRVINPNSASGVMAAG